jgi:coproporphyrinogen III oxidase-like Fe-S oxidoreductase
LSDVFNVLKLKFSFSENIEITLESTPNNITKDNLIIWNNLGINRLSI